ncbi:adenylate kinase family protein [Ignisphaera sp. 4213-co]|uniref:Putative adenylate kinase n=1 Tax=Ignisphaera cupida TaxID=3050454 RepID=A0ABD4Z8R0_9CREN|nr:adenylate kinase family protein [Ignisphaera sp. 4213-co]MDK6028660.1 adenylate kinase family protein [Ignisphaera sp. 4213-co]
MKSIGISGVPGTGKSQLAKRVSQELGLDVVELSDFAIRNNYVIAFDSERKSYIIDEEKLGKSIEKLAKESGPLIIVGHYVEIVPRDVLEIVFVLRRNPVELIKILENRGWDGKKIAENIEAELVGVCTANAVEELGEEMVVEIDVTSKSVNEVAEEVIKIIFGEKPVYYGYSVDWLSKLSKEELAYLLEFIEKFSQATQL